MKKIFLGIFAIICLFVLVGCVTEEPPVIEPGTGVGDNTEDLERIENYKKELIEVLDNSIPSHVTENIELLDEYAYEDESFASIEWKSSNEQLVTRHGRFKNHVFAGEVTLTATIEIFNSWGENVTFEYNKTVTTPGQMEISEYKKIVESQIPDYIFEDVEFVTKEATFRGKNIFGYITYVSSKPDVLSADGKYLNQNEEDQEVELFYTVDVRGTIIEGSKLITVEGKKVTYYSEKVVEFLNNHFQDVDVVYDQLDLPETDDYGRVMIEWKSLDLSVLSHQGEIQTYEPNKEGKMQATITCYDTTFTWERSFRTYKEGELLDFLVNRIHRETIQQYVLKVYAYSAQNYGFIPFYNQDIALSDLVVSTTANNETITYLHGEHNSNTKQFKVTTGLIPWGGTGRTKIKKKSTNFITIHDTGDANQSAAVWNEYESSGSDKRQTSWHFTVGDVDMYQHVPLEEVAWHAGDGSAEFGLSDSGVKYDGPNPKITLGDDKYLYINGQKSRIFTSWQATGVSPAGIYTCLGKNGNYYIADTHVSSYWSGIGEYQVCTNGGNRNSIGIETCINRGVDYNQVMRNTSNLVANLLMYYDLEPDRVLYHQHFSGKLCPQVMIQNEILDNFHNMIENEYIIKKYLPNVKITYNSHEPDLLSNDGKILKAVNSDTTVTYDVTITYNGETKTYTLKTLIKPIK